MFPLLSVCNKVYQRGGGGGGGGGAGVGGGGGIKTIQCIGAEEIHIRINFSATDSCCNSYSFISLKKTNVRKR